MVYDARPDILFRATVAGITILEYDVISVVHVSSDSGNHFSVPLCNLHRVKHSALVFSDEVLQIRIDRHSLADGNKTGTVDAETLKEMTTVNDDVSKLATGDNEQGTPQENAEDDENASNEDKATNPPTEQENGENGANTEPDKATEEQQEDKVIIPQGKMRVTVICDGSLNIRRSAAWGNDNICGRAIRGQSYYVKEIHVVDGKKMVRTIGDLYLSGESEHVQFEQL
ncbi:hypothetical protein [Dorea sp. 210702-DFI.3.17]|uniref:hypothetical protein n=1 Tax=Dorea sp. 210702-DFI.3.17 TaxID=2883208 RepID=UPI001D098F61|nr:hypothetical protein [Dorea sp. 210702-DFI.3.17]